MQIFTKLSNRFKYSKSRKLQASAQTRLTAKTIYAVPGNSVIIDASFGRQTDTVLGRALSLRHSHARFRDRHGNRTDKPSPDISSLPAPRCQKARRPCRPIPSRMDEGDLNAVILVNRHDRKRPHRLAITSINQRLGSRCQALRDMALIQRMQVIVLSISDRHHHRRVPQRQSAPLFITQPWPIAIGFQSTVRQLGEYEW